VSAITHTARTSQRPSARGKNAKDEARWSKPEPACGQVTIECGEYELKVPYSSDDDLDKRMHELLGDIASEADDRNCFSESDARMEGSDRYW
jgi:hypothetical protein